MNYSTESIYFNGTCVASNGHFVCYCKKGFNGRMCEQDNGHHDPSLPTTPAPLTEPPEKKCKLSFSL